ncbi:MAG: MFS transporter [Deltaproteobacteria bacterium]|nr:MFS transporter [Deltaproteobacteria bacterium]
MIFILLNFHIFMGFNILLPTLSLYMEKQGLSGREIGLIYSIFTVSAITMRSSSAYLASGRISPLFLISLGLFICALASFGYYWAVDVPRGLLFRFLHGAGFGITSTLITALASQVIPQSRMGEGMSYLGLGTTISLAAGPFLGIWLMNEWGFLILFAAVAVCYLAGMGVSRFLPPISLASSGSSRRPGLVVLSRMVRVPSLLMFILGLILSSIIIFMALFCQEQKLPYVGHFFVVSSISIIISRLFSGRLYDRFGHRRIIPPSVFLLLLVTLLLFYAQNGLMMLCAATLYGFCIGAAFPSMTALTLSYAPMERRAEATASFFNCYDLGFGVGSVLMGQIADLAGSYRVIFLTSAGMAILFLLLYAFFYLRHSDGS